MVVEVTIGVVAAVAVTSVRLVQAFITCHLPLQRELRALDICILVTLVT